jgi:hypothetical protein
LNKLVLVVGELAHTINALPTPRLLGPPTLHKHLLVDSECGFQGNPDLYGLGIRLGIYLQAIATILTNAFVSEAVSDYRDNNTIFLFALLIAVAKSAPTAQYRPSKVLSCCGLHGRSLSALFLFTGGVL